MATAAEIAAWQADQRDIPFPTVAEAALACLVAYDLEPVHRRMFGRLVSAPDDPESWHNWMLHDQQGRFLWLHGSGAAPILTYSASEWPYDPPGAA